jgi:hypothetical protein
MKATCFLLLTMSSAPLMQWTNDAAISQQTSAKSSANSDSDHPHDAESAIPGDDAKRQKNGTLLEGQRDPPLVLVKITRAAPPPLQRIILSNLRMTRSISHLVMP